MRYFLVGLMMSLLAGSLAFAQEPPADENGSDGAAKYEVTGVPLYQGPEYRSIDSTTADITMDPSFHSFHHRPADEVGYSPLTLEDFRFPVPARADWEFKWERLEYPEHSMQIWHDKDHQYEVTAFFFTRDMIRDHIQQIIDTYYVCEPDLLQQIIDYYAEVTPQCGEAISWVWFRVIDKGHDNTDKWENRYFTSYLSNFKDKIYLQFGLPKAQNIVDRNVRDFLYQYRHRGKHHCSAEFQERAVCGCIPGKECENKCFEFNCNVCPEPYNEPHDKALYCEDFCYGDFDLDLNAHYLYAPRKVVIEDITYDPLAQAYRWKFAWRFNDCEVDWLKQMCQYGEFMEISMVLSDPHWFMNQEVNKFIKKDLLAAMDPSTWGNVWAAGNLPYDTTCCECQMPNCPGNCIAVEPVGWDYVEPVEVVPTPVVTPPPAEDANDFGYFPPQEEEEEEVIAVPGKG